MDHESATVINALIGLIGKLVWPVVAIVFLLAFRENVRSLIDRIASISLPGSKFLFQKPASSSPNPSAELKAATFELGPDGFLTDLARRKIVQEAKLEKHPEYQRELLLYNNPTQRTWLLTTKVNLYILLDDPSTRSASTVIQTYFEKSKALPLKFGVDNETGLVAFAAEEDWWYYGKSLFPSEQKLYAAISRLVK
jgi:hypothetical protein